MKKVRTYAVLVSMVASVSMLSACSDNETDDLSDTGAAVESPATQTPPATTPAPAVTETPPATSPAPAATDTPPAPGSAPGAADTPPASAADPSEDSPANSQPNTGDTDDDSVTDITPEPDTL